VDYTPPLPALIDFVNAPADLESSIRNVILTQLETSLGDERFSVFDESQRVRLADALIAALFSDKPAESIELPDNMKWVMVEPDNFTPALEMLMTKPTLDGGVRVGQITTHDRTVSQPIITAAVENGLRTAWYRNALHDLDVNKVRDVIVDNLIGADLNKLFASRQEIAALPDMEVRDGDGQ
jgi:hypothetical protein